jgi:hypothetical protein
MSCPKLIFWLAVITEKASEQPGPVLGFVLPVLQIRASKNLGPQKPF